MKRPKTVHLSVATHGIVCNTRSQRPLCTEDPKAYSCTNCGAMLTKKPQLLNYIARAAGLRVVDVPILLRDA